MDKLEAKLLKEIADLDSLPVGAYNIRKNGGAGGRNNTAHIAFDATADTPGIDMHIAPGRLGGNRLAHSYAWGDMERLGLHLAFGTDCPVERFHPLEGVYCAVTRRDFTGNGPFLPEQALTPYQALYAYTAGGAYASGEERIKGRIRSGLLADFLLVDRNLLTCPPEELLSARVLRTYVGGACVFRDPSF